MRNVGNRNASPEEASLLKGEKSDVCRYGFHPCMSDDPVAMPIFEEEVADDMSILAIQQVTDVRCEARSCCNGSWWLMLLCGCG